MKFFFTFSFRTSAYVQHAILEINKLVLLDNGDYSCKAANALGKAQSKLKLRGKSTTQNL